MFFWHKHDLHLALQDLANWTPGPDQWREEEKIIFQEAFKLHGKSFQRIREMLPDKSMAALVKYYYRSVQNKQSKQTLKTRIT